MDMMQTEAGDIWFVEAVCLRPVMYTLHGTVEEVICFIHGFYSGMLAHSTDTRSRQHAHHRWFGFLTWHAQQQAETTTSDWVMFYTMISADQSRTAAATFDQIRGLYRAYRTAFPNAAPGERRDPAAPPS